MIKYLVGILLIIITSCSPQKRVQRIIKNNPWLQIKDTAKVEVEVPVPKEEYDTIWDVRINDSLIIDEDRMRLEILKIRDSLGRMSHFDVDVTLKPDTFRLEVPVPYDRIETVEVETNKIPIWIIILMSCMGVAILIVGTKK